MELIGKHVKLRAKTRKDLPLYERWLMKADPLSIPKELGYVIADLQDNRGIGCIGLQHIDWKNRCGSEAFFLIDKTSLNNNSLAFGLYAAEAAALFLNFVDSYCYGEI